jgi:hypothetical protein
MSGPGLAALLDTELNDLVGGAAIQGNLEQNATVAVRARRPPSIDDADEPPQDRPLAFIAETSALTETSSKLDCHSGPGVYAPAIENESVPQKDQQRERFTQKPHVASPNALGSLTSVTRRAHTP